MSEKRFIWLVEAKFRETWQPCADAYLTRKEALSAIEVKWKHNTGLQFRVRKYAALEDKSP